MLTGFENLGVSSNMLIDPSYFPTFDELAVDYPENCVPVLDQKTVKIKWLSEDQRHWRDHGYVIKRGFIPTGLVDEFNRLRKKLDLGRNGFPNAAPFLDHRVIRDICCYKPLHYLLVDLIGEEMGLHFNLSDYKSSTRGWHQDEYLNPIETYSRYCAIWFAMGDIHPNSGPFEFIPGSHKWRTMSGEKVRSFIKPEGRDYGQMAWPIYAEHFVNKAVVAKAAEMGQKVEKFIAGKGDVLIWHSKLAHRGSVPLDKGMTRPALIAHYSNIRSRRDFSCEISRHRDGGYFWDMGAGQFSENADLTQVIKRNFKDTRAWALARKIKRTFVN